ncbi:distal tail protein Dit, partial [Lacticaseibacillus rhamnosus]
MANLIFGGRKIGSSVLQFSAARGITSEIENTSHSVGISDGEMLINSRLKSRIIPVTYDFVALSRREFERQLAPLLYSSGVQKLIIDDRPDEFWYAKVDGKIDMDRAYFLGTGTINFLVPDGIAHSVATQTFDNMPYKDIPLNLMAGTSADPVSVTGSGWNIQKLGSFNNPTVGKKYAATVLLGRADFAVSFQLWANDINGNRISLAGFPVTTQMGANQRSTIVCTWPDPGTTGAAQIEVTLAWAFQKTDVGTYQYLKAKLEEGTTYSTWSPNPADAAYYANTIMVHNGGTYPVEPIITATMHADNGMVGIVNDRPGILQFGTQEIDGFTTEESEVALDLAAVQGSHMDNQAATNNPYWGGDPSMPNEQIGNAIWTQDSYDGWKVEPNWPSITGTHLYWNGPSIKHDLAQTHNGDFKSNLTWDVMTRFQTGVAQVGALETTLESDGKPIFQMILKDNSALSDQLWWMCYYKDQLVVNEQLDRSIFTNDKFIQLELQKFGNSVVFRVSP